MKMNVTSQIHKFIETSAIADIFNKTMEKDMAYEFLATSHDFVSDVVEDYKLAKEYTCSERSYNFKYKSVSDFYGLLAEFLAGGGTLNDAEDYLKTVSCLDDYNSIRVVEEFRKENFKLNVEVADMQINELKNNIGNIVEGIFYVQDYQICSGTKSKYANVVISDATGSHTARQWEESFTGEEKKLIGKIVSITGKVNTWEGTPSLSVSVMEEAAEGTYNMSDIIKCLTSEQEKRLVGILNSYISSINDEGIKNVVKHLFNENYNSLKTLPAGIKMHHSFIGGLLVHIVEVTSIADAFLKMSATVNDVKEYSTNIDSDLVIAGALLHDIGKCMEYRGFPCAKISTIGGLSGHLVLGARMLREANTAIISNGNEAIDDIKLELLEHIILASHGEYGVCTPRILEGLIVYKADDFSAATDGHLLCLAEDKELHPESTDDFFKSRSGYLMRRR